MGTNYYLKTDFCPCCGKPRKTIHQDDDFVTGMLLGQAISGGLK